MFGSEAIDIWLAYRSVGAEHAENPAFGEQGGGFDRRNGADDGYIERGADMLKRDGGRRVAGDDGEARSVTLDQPAEQSWHAGGDFRFALRTVRKACTVGGVDDPGSGQRRTGRGQDG